MRRTDALIVLGLLTLAALLAQLPAWAQNPRTARPKRAKPPTWDQRTKDAFFEDVDSALAGPRPQYNGGRGGATVAGGNTTPSPGVNDDPAPAGGIFAWSKLISPETIEDEIKTIGKELGKVVTTPQQFAGGANRTANLHFSTLAILFGVIGEYDGEVRWKKVAPGARDLFAQAGFGARVSSIQAYNQSKAAKQSLEELIGGGTIPASQAEAKAKWDKVAYRPPLMQRLKIAHEEKMQPWTANPAEFKKHNDAILHEAEMIAAIAEIITREGYEYADDTTYVQHAHKMRAGALNIINAVKQKNADAARQAAGDITKSCAACHDGYRGSG